MDDHTRQLLIEAAILAPSADNSQPWLYRWNDNALNLWIDETRSGGFSDQRQVLSDLAIGACLENIVIRAYSLGYNHQIEYLPDPDGSPLWAAKLSFSPAPAPQEEALANVMPDRHADRSFPWKGPVSLTTKQNLREEIEKIPGVKLTWLDGTPHYKTALKIMWLAESLRFGCKGLHQELFSSIRFDVGNNASCEEGLAPATLVIETPLKPAFKTLRHWQVMRALNWIGVNYLIGFRSVILPTLLSPALCLLSIEQIDRVSVIQAGRAMQRLWLKTTEQGFALQPFAAAGIISLGFIQLPVNFISVQHKISHGMNAIAGADRGILFFRLGITSRPRTAIHSQRRATPTFIK